MSFRTITVLLHPCRIPPKSSQCLVRCYKPKISLPLLFNCCYSTSQTPKLPITEISHQPKFEAGNSSTKLAPTEQPKKGGFISNIIKNVVSDDQTRSPNSGFLFKLLVKIIRAIFLNDISAKELVTAQRVCNSVLQHCEHANFWEHCGIQPTFLGEFNLIVTIYFVHLILYF